MHPYPLCEQPTLPTLIRNRGTRVPTSSFNYILSTNMLEIIYNPFISMNKHK